MLGAMAFLPPYVYRPLVVSLLTLDRATPLSFSTWAIFGLIFNWWIHRRWTGWWHTYNYITAAGLDSGLIISTIIIFFAITLPKVSAPTWWGNTAPFQTAVSSCMSVWPWILTE